MVMWSYPSTPKQRAATALCFAVGVLCLVVGGHMAFSNVEPSRARVQARNEFVKERLRRYLDDQKP